MKTEHFWSEQWKRSLARRLVYWLVSWRTIRRVLIGVVAVVTLVTLFYAVVNWRGSRAWKDHVQSLQSRGESVTFAALSPPEVAEEDNLGTIPLFRPLFDVRQGEAGMEWNDPQGKRRLEVFRVPGRSGRGNPPECNVGNLGYDCWTDFGSCLRFYLEQEEQPLELAGDSDAARLLTYLKRYDDVLEELSEAARHRPGCRFPVEYDAEMPFAILLPHLAPLKNVASVLSLRAIARLEQGEGDAAFEDLELGLRLSDGIADEPILISHLVRLVILSSNLQVVREGIARQAWTEPQLVELQSRLAGIDLLAEARHAFEGERAGAVGSVDYVRRLGTWYAANELESLLGSSGWEVERIFQIMPDGWFYANMLKVSELHQEHSLGAVDLEARRIDPVKVNVLERVVESLPLRPSTVFVRMLVPAMSRALSRTAQSQTYLDAAQVACALERHRLAGSALPASLQDLVPRFLKRVPTDVIDGQPLRYRPGERGAYLLYGVGWNRQDDGGLLGWEGEGAKATLNTRTGDWVWRCDSLGAEGAISQR